MTIYRGPGGTGSASSDADTTQFQEFLVQTQAARDAAQTAQVAAEAAAETAAGNVDAGVAASAASATAAAGSASAAAMSATNASSSASSASTSATNAASSASSASTSASSASTSATNAGNSATAAATSATAASASASAAASSASTATTQASNAAGSASSASTSASTATTQASNAASSASAASSSATAATSSATSAASSATAAASSATAAAASAASINDAALVHKTGDETIGGVKTFTSSIAGSITGTAANVTGTVAIANGGTGQTTRQNAMDALAGSVTSGQYLRGNGTDVVMSAIQAADVPTLNQNTTGNAATATTATNAANVTATTSGTNSAFKVPFLNTTANTTGNYGLLHDSQSTFNYNPSTNTLNVDFVEAATRFSTGGSANGGYFARNNTNAQVMDFGVGTGTGQTTDIGLFNVVSGSLVFGTNNVYRGRIDANGYFVLGSYSASYNYNGNSLSWVSNAGGLVLSNTSTGGVNQIVFNNPNGQVGYVNTVGTSTVYASVSDYRLKKDVQPMVGALQKIAMLKPCTYKWKIDDTDGQGFIAHELQEVIPSCVSGEKDAVREDGTPKYQGIDTSFLAATLTAAIQEQQAIIQDMKARIEALEATNP